MPRITSPPKFQSGAALLVIMLVVVVGASFVLISKLNANTRQYIRQGSNMAVLNEAKAALIGYAVTYPERQVAITAGPGTLPCPDRDNDGDAESGCSYASSNTIGRVPWKTLETSHIRDKANEELWYIVSNKFRSSSADPINSETESKLTVFSTSDIAAVIIAPGPALTSQDRPSDSYVDYAEYIEGVGANTDNDDFEISLTSGSNDTVVFITKQELMETVEKRVLGDVVQVLTSFQSDYNAFPWLSTFSNPATSIYRGQINAKDGHLPFHYSADGSPRNPFTTDLNITWSNISNAILSPADSNAITSYFNYQFIVPAPTQACIESSECLNASDPFNGLLPVSLPITGASCTWSNKKSFSCTGSYQITTSVNYDIWNNDTNNDQLNYSWTAGTGVGWIWADYGSGSEWKQVYRNTTCGECWGYHKYRERMSGTLQRTYTFDITFTDPDNITITNPTAAAVRTRDLDISGSLASATVSITVTDELSNIAFDTPYSYTATTLTSTNTLASDNDTTGTIASTGLHFDLDADGINLNGDNDYDDPGEEDAELPSWFINNDWNKLIYIVYSDTEPLPGNTSAGQDCNTLVGPCLTVTDDGINVTTNSRAVAVSAGSDITGSRPTSVLTDYLENDNSDGDDIFIRDKLTATYNDQTRVISVAP